MKLMCLDLGNRCGFACGIAGEKPRVEAWVLKGKGDAVESACRSLACTLRDNIQFEAPDLIATEHWMHPAAQPSADVMITHLQLHGVVESLAGIFGIPVKRPKSSEFRVHFCGAASAAPRRKQPRTAKQRAEDRHATNMMVVRRAILLGYLPHGSTDFDKASAAAIFDWASATFARSTPQRLVLFGEGATA